MSEAHLRFTNFLGKRLHLGVCGSIAAYKALDVLRQLTASGASVSATLTAAAQRFVTPLSFEALGADPVHGGMWQGSAEGRSFGHLEPGQGADAMVIAPATANTLAKLAHGLADDMLSCQALAFAGPLVVAPAMNPLLWQAAATRENWERLKARGVVALEPGVGAMACGDTGQGRLPEVREIVLAALRAATTPDMAGRRVLVNLGPTREAWDAVRVWTNGSTGIMGGAVAMAAWLRGAEVTAVCGPAGSAGEIWLPGASQGCEGIERIDVISAREMHDACLDLWPDMDMACLTAAVADFRPEPYGDRKFKKAAANQGFSIAFQPNPDILRHMGQAKASGQYLIGFAAETDDLEAGAKAKLAAKNLDMVVANQLDAPGSGFAVPTNQVLVLTAEGRREVWPELPKTEVAWRIWDIASSF